MVTTKVRSCPASGGSSKFGVTPSGGLMAPVRVGAPELLLVVAAVAATLMAAIIRVGRRERATSELDLDHIPTTMLSQAIGPPPEWHFMRIDGLWCCTFQGMRSDWDSLCFVKSFLATLNKVSGILRDLGGFRARSELVGSPTRLQPQHSWNWHRVTRPV